MELQEQLERIEQLKTDRNIQVIIAGTKTIHGMADSCQPLVNKHLSKKNKTINKKIYEFYGDITDTLDLFTDNHYEEAEKAIRAFCGLDENYIYGASIYDYLFEEIDMDEFVESLKDTAVSINEYKIDVQKGLTPSLEERVKKIEQLKTDEEVLNLLDMINSNESGSSAVIRLSKLISEKISLPEMEVFERVQFVTVENSFDKLVADLIDQTKNYVNGGYFREEA